MCDYNPSPIFLQSSLVLPIADNDHYNDNYSTFTHAGVTWEESTHGSTCLSPPVCAGSLTLAGEAVDVEVRPLDSHHLPSADLPAALAHDGRTSTSGERRAAVVVPSVET